MTPRRRSIPPTQVPSAWIVEALDPPLEPVGRESGADTQRAQERLLELGFWVQATTGEYGITTIQAVMALQKTGCEIQFGDSVTRPGLLEVDREREDGWWEGDLGEIHRPKYFDYGIAFRESLNVPDYPASHGCVRLSIPAMDWIWDEDLFPMGTAVWVHGEIPVDESDDA